MPSPLIADMIEKYGYPLLGEAELEAFINAHEECVLFFTEDPARFPESNDVAMILPELVREYGDRFQAAVIEQASQRKLQSRYNFSEWPTLVFLRHGAYLGAVSRVQNWTDYIVQINDILTQETKPNPGIGIPVLQPSSPSACH